MTRPHDISNAAHWYIVFVVPFLAQLSCTEQANPSSVRFGSVEIQATPFGMVASVDGGRLSARSDLGEIGIQLTEWGRGHSLISAEPTQPVEGTCGIDLAVSAGICKERITLIRPGLTEYWTATDSGLEQSWRVSERPDGSGPVVLRIGIDAGRVFSIDRAGQAAVLRGSRGGVWNYTGLSAWDSVARPVSATFVAASGGLEIQVDDGDAVYPIVVDPTLSQDIILQPPGLMDYDGFGRSVNGGGDLNGDGFGDVVVGSSGDAGGTGAVYVYFGGPVSPAPLAHTKLTASDAQPSSAFGFDVAVAGDVNGDGFDDVVVGSPSAGVPEPGAAYVYLGGPGGLDSASELKLTVTDTARHFGETVQSAGDVNGDGFDDIVVGVPEDQDVAYRGGAIYLFYGSAMGVAVHVQRGDRNHVQRGTGTVSVA